MAERFQFVPDAQPTDFAPAGRATPEDLANQVRRILKDPCVKVVLEVVNGYVMFLNRQRQVVAASQELLEALGRNDPACLIGLRPGEVLNCVYFTEGPDGCGTSKHCRGCGAVLALLASQAGGTPAIDECRLSIYQEGRLVALDMRVRCSPLEIGGERLTAMVLHDISSLKRREVLEQLFLHDFLNALGGIEGWSRLLQETGSATAAREIIALAESLKTEIVSQRALLDAENGQLRTDLGVCHAREILAALQIIFEHHSVREGKGLEIQPEPPSATFVSDRSLLLRVLVNMLKNAFEATDPGGVVRLWFEWRDGRPGFVVQNPAVIPEAIRLHLFERSFSTKAAHGRGLGTYSMKLYGERYLGGTVACSSDETAGTKFSIFLPTGGEDTIRNLKHAKRRQRSLVPGCGAAESDLDPGWAMFPNGNRR